MSALQQNCLITIGRVKKIRRQVKLLINCFVCKMSLSGESGRGNNCLSVHIQLIELL